MRVRPALSAYYPRRSGSLARVMLPPLAAIVAMAAGGWFFFAGDDGDGGDAPLLTAVTRGPYEHIVLEQGEVESSNNVTVVCEVKNRAGGDAPSTTILEVIPEGTPVKKGDWLITFDSSALENELTQQRILAKTSETLVIQAKAAYETAVMALKEYIEGTYLQERKTIENAIFVAEESVKKAELSYGSIQRSVARGLVSELQLQGEQYRVDAARKELELGQKKLDVLDNYTKEKMATQLRSDIEATKIQFENEQASYQEELKKLEEIQQQIARCTVTAPAPGQVVYANVYSSRSSSEFVVERGAAVRERQEIIHLPDPTQMQVTTKVSETRINLVKEKMPAAIRVDALGDVTLHGVVTKVNKYAEPGNWWGASGREYKVLVQILKPPPQIRTGLTAEVRIKVEERDDALQVPVQAVLERKGRTFCLVQNDRSYETREVVIASTNDKMIALDESTSGGLRPDEQVVLSPREHIDKFDFTGFLGEEELAPAPGDEPLEQVAADAEPAGVGVNSDAGEEASSEAPAVSTTPVETRPPSDAKSTAAT